MNVKRLAVILLLCGVVGFLWVEMFLITKEAVSLQGQYEEVEQEKISLEQENTLLEKDLAYYAIPENLKKELRERLNYKETGERMIIVVPSQ